MEWSEIVIELGLSAFGLIALLFVVVILPVGIWLDKRDRR